MTAAGVPDERTNGGAVEDTLGFRREQKWRQKTDRRRRALEDDDNGDRNRADKGQRAAGLCLQRK